MKKIILLWLLALASVWSSALEVNRLLVLPFRLHGPSDADAPQVVAKLTALVQKYIAQKEYYRLMGSESVKSVFAQASVRIGDLHDLQKRSQAIVKLYPAIDYLWLGEIRFHKHGALAVNCKFFHTASGKLHKSAAVLGRKGDLEDLISSLIAKIIPDQQEILQEISNHYREFFKQKEYLKALAYASWGLRITPKSWKYAYWRGLAYEASGYYILAKQDYQDASKFYDKPLAEISRSLKRLAPAIAELKLTHQRLLREITAMIKRIKQEHSRHFIVFPEILREMSGKDVKVANLYQLAVSMPKLIPVLTEELRQAQINPINRHNHNQARRLWQRVNQLHADIEKIESHLRKGFEEQGKIYFNQALDALKGDQLAATRMALEKSRLLLPEFAEVYYLSGRLWQLQKKYRRAIVEFTKAIGFDQRHYEAYYLRAISYYDLRQWGKAQADLLTALELKPKSAPAHFALAATYEVQLQNDKSLRHYNLAIKYDPQYAAAYFHRGKLFERDYRYFEAHADYKRAIEINGDLQGKIRPQLERVNDYIRREALIYANKAKSALDDGDIAIAIDYFGKALRLYPDYSYALFNRGFAYHLTGSYPKAIADYSQAIRIDNKEAKLYYYRALSRQRNNEAQAALADLQETLRIDSGYHQAYHRMAMIFEQLQQRRQAISYYQKAITAYPARSYYYFDLARLYDALGQKADADSSRIQARERQKSQQKPTLSEGH